MATDKARLDVTLVDRGLAPSRQRAAQMIKAGYVRVNGVIVRKAAFPCTGDDRVEARDPLPYVGRGGLKLEAALDAFAICPQGLRCLDVGASTGGFTDCLLQRGAARVYAVDVGRGQLAQSLRQDKRVVCLEQTDVRALEPWRLDGPVRLVVCDVSFISLTLVLPALYRLLENGGEAVALIKPQFEVGPALVGKGGIVKAPKARAAAIRQVAAAAKDAGFTVLGLIASPVSGGDGNREYCIHLAKGVAVGASLDLECAIETVL